MEYIARMNPPKVIGLVALAEKPGLVEALRIMRRELSRHGLNSCVIAVSYTHLTLPTKA